MKRNILALIALITLSCGAMAQPAKAVLDKVAAVVSNKGGASASFRIASSQYGNTTGSIAIKGRKFKTTTPAATVWFDGTTQWTYMARSNEVNINTPTEGELQAINPYNFINMYRTGFTYKMKTVGTNYQVHLTATNKPRQIQEMYITVNKSTYVPTQIKMRQGANWSTIVISNFKKANLNDATFTFNAKAYPKAEIIDLR